MSVSVILCEEEDCGWRLLVDGTVRTAESRVCVCFRFVAATD